MKGTLDVEVAENNAMTQKGIVSKNDVPFRSCVLKSNNIFVDNAEDIDIALPMYNLLEYSENYSMTSGSLRNYYRDKVDNFTPNKAVLFEGSFFSFFFLFFWGVGGGGEGVNLSPLLLPLPLSFIFQEELI